MGKVTDADVERYVMLSGQPRTPPRGGSGGKPSWHWLMAAFVPKREEVEPPPPPPCRQLMKDGVWLVPQKVTAAPECTSEKTPCGAQRESNPQQITNEVTVLPLDDACTDELVGAAVQDVTPRPPRPKRPSEAGARPKSQYKFHLAWTARGLCRDCCKPFTPSARSRIYHDACLDKRNEAYRRRRKALLK